MDQFHLYNQIGETGTARGSTVYKARRKESIEYFAAKSIPIEHYDAVCAEVAVLHELEHPCVVKLHHWYRTRNNVWLVLDYCTGGNLRTILKADGFLPEDTVSGFASDLAAGLHYLHARRIALNNLCPSGLLLGVDGCLRLSDFSCAARLDDPATVTVKQSSVYTAPEVRVHGAAPSASTDLWSLGVLVVEMAFGLPPAGTELSEQTQLPATAGAGIVDVLRLLLLREPEARSWAAVLGSEFWSEKLRAHTAGIELGQDGSATAAAQPPAAAAEETEVGSETERRRRRSIDEGLADDQLLAAVELAEQPDSAR